MKKPFETEMDDTRQAVGQIVCLCTTIALHQEFGVGKTRLERIKARIDELENQNTEVIMTPDANGRPSKDKAEQGVQNKVQLIMQQVSQQPFERRRRR